MDEEKSQEQAKPEPKPEGIDYDKLASILDGRQKATEESVLKGYFKDQGMTGEEMAQAIKSFKEAQAAKQPDIGGMERSIAELQARIEKADKATLAAKLENAVIVEATKMGIDPKAIPYLVRMADLSDVGDGGAISADRIAESLGKVLDDLPMLKPKAAEEQGFKVGAGDKESPQKIEQDKLKAIFGVK